MSIEATEIQAPNLKTEPGKSSPIRIIEESESAEQSIQPSERKKRTRTVIRKVKRKKPIAVQLEVESLD